MFRLGTSPTGMRVISLRVARSITDTVFIPEDPDGHAKGKTYAEIVDDASLGLEYKLKLSQSTAAMLAFLEYRLKSAPPLWSGRP